MANPEHLQKLQQGVAAWNPWRRQNEDIRPDLTRANLGSANLTRAILREANLGSANLTRAILREANLGGAILRGADLGGADLAGAILAGADLGSVDLRRANLAGTDLRGAILRGADFTGANLSHVGLFETVFGDTNLTAVQGLEICDHFGPSTLDHRTLARSGPLPLAFLRGCGLSDWEIEMTKLYDQRLTSGQVTDILYHMHHLRTDSFIQFYSCFISYSSADEDFCRRLHGRLQDAGLRVWFAPHDIHGGQKLHEQIDQAIRVHDKLLLVLSAHSIQSPWVEFEIRQARKREVAEQRRLLFPVRLVDYEAIKRWECFDADTAKDLATEIREYFVPDFTAWKDHDAFEAAVARLLRDLTDTAQKPDASA